MKSFHAITAVHHTAAVGPQCWKIVAASVDGSDTSSVICASRFGIDYVTVLAKDGSAADVPVQTAPSLEGGKVEVLSGVAAGDTLVAPKQAAAQ